MTPRSPVSSRRTRAVWLILLPLLGVLAYFVGLHLGGAPFKDAMLSETGPIELGTAALYLASAGGVGALALVTRGTVPLAYRACYGLLALGALVVTLEEVSYGQHLFSWQSPPWFAAHNVKGEINLHNLYGDRPTRTLRNLALVGYGAVGVVLPGLARLRRREYPRGHWTHYLLPRGEIATLVVLAILLRRLRKLPSSAFSGLDLGLDELMELCLAAAALVYVLVLWRRLAQERAGAPPVTGTGLARLARLRPRDARGDRRLLLALSLLVVGAGIGLRDPWGVDEERFVGVALELLQRGDWLVLYRAGEPYADKPPLFMWVLALAYRLTGSVGLTLRLPGLLSALASVALVHDLGGRLWHRRAGLAAGLLFLGAYQSVSVLRGGQIDSLLVLWTTLGLYGLIRHLVRGPSWGWYTVAGVAMGLGVISKGVGFLPLLVLAPYALGRYRGFHHLSPIPLRDGRWLLAPLGLLAAIALWLVPLATRVAGSADPVLHAYLRNILFRQTAERFVGAWQHQEPVWYFLVEVIPLFWLPAVLFLPWLVPAWWNRLRRADGRYLLLLGWVLLVVLFFSLSTGKRKVYIYPALPAFALAAAPLSPWLGRRLAKLTGRRRILAIAAVTYFGGLIVWGMAEPLLLDRRYSRRGVMAAVARQLGPERQVALVGWREGYWLFAENPLVHFGYRGGPDQVHQAQAWLRAAPDRWLLAPARMLRACFDLRRAIRAGREKGQDLLLVEASMDTGRCPPHPPEPLYHFRWAPALAHRLARSAPRIRLRVQERPEAGNAPPTPDQGFGSSSATCGRAAPAPRAYDQNDEAAEEHVASVYPQGRTSVRGSGRRSADRPGNPRGEGASVAASRPARCTAPA